MPRAKTAERKSIYSVHPGVQMVQKWIAELKQKTGRSLEEWMEFCRKSGPPTETERRDWLKQEHGLGTNSAWWIAERAEGKGIEDGHPDTYLKAAEEYVEAMFAGSRAGLRPIYTALLELCLGLADDVKACPCQTIVPLYRKHVFAEIKPATRTRIDLGVALAKAPGRMPARLIDTGGAAKKNRITHRFAITHLDEIDAEVKKWLRVAYDLDE